MSMRIFSWALATLLLAACAQPAPEALPGDSVLCALDGAKPFEQVCTLDVSRKGGIDTLVVRHPDGKFRRIDVLDNGRGLAVADGATQAITRYADGYAEVAVEDDRYRFPVQSPVETKIRADAETSNDGP